MFIKRELTKQAISFRKPVYGVGINDANYMVTSKLNGKLFRCEIYKTWSNMLKRCYCKKAQDKNPTYKGCSVCDEWLVFSNFARWMKKQDWKGKQLDKDLIKDRNKIYSPDTCVFVDSQVNSLFTRSFSASGFKINKKSRKFVVRCRANGKDVHIGVFDDKKDAKNAYISFKASHVIELASMHNKHVRMVILNKLRLFVESQKRIGN